MKEVGIANRELNKWKTKRPECQKSSTDSDPVTFFEVVPSLLFLGVGFLFSLFVFLAELSTIKSQDNFGIV